VEADEKIKRVVIEDRQSSLLAPSPSLFPTIICDIVCYFCGILITKSGGCSRFSGRPSLLCSAVQTASVRVDTLRNFTDVKQVVECLSLEGQGLSVRYSHSTLQMGACNEIANLICVYTV